MHFRILTLFKDDIDLIIVFIIELKGTIKSEIFRKNLFRFRVEQLFAPVVCARLLVVQSSLDILLH